MKITSGGQTGVDRAALDAARTLELDYGGAIPKGRKAEDGPLPDSYAGMTELGSPHYPPRTAKNVSDADATLIFTLGRPGRGSMLTMKIAEQRRKPYLHIDLSRYADAAASAIVREWLTEVEPEVLNVAGSRSSEAPDIYERVRKLLCDILKQ